MPLRIVAFASAFAMVLGVANAETDSADENNKLEWHGWLKETEMVFRIRLDPVLRAIVCRVPYTEISPNKLAWAIRATPNRMMEAIVELERMGLIKMEPPFKFDGNIVPASRHALDQMRRWAEEWCTSDDKCELGS